MNQRNIRGAFTLIELLTVIAIIGILASILIPVVGKVRESARQAVCTSNVRQLAMAMILYTGENNGYLPYPASGGGDGVPPHANDWVYWQNGRELRNSAIGPYVGEALTEDLFRCPSDDTRTAEQYGIYPFSYTLNTYLTVNHQLGGRIGTLPYPSQIMMMGEEQSPNDGLWDPPHQHDRLSTRHGERGNVAFADGHVRLVTPHFAAFRGHWDPFNTSPVAYRPR